MTTFFAEYLSTSHHSHPIYQSRQANIRDSNLAPDEMTIVPQNEFDELFWINLEKPRGFF